MLVLSLISTFALIISLDKKYNGTGSNAHIKNTYKKSQDLLEDVALSDEDKKNLELLIMELEQKKKELEMRINSCLKANDVDGAKKLIEQMEEIVMNVINHVKHVEIRIHV